MLFQLPVVLLALASVASVASAAPQKPQPRILQHDDVILPRADGGFDIMKDWEWSHVERRLLRDARLRAEENKRAALAGELAGPAGTRAGGGLAPRDDCEQSSEVQVLTNETFTDWDVAMSPVIGATGGQANIAVAKGYSVTNSITVGVSAELTFIDKVFKASVKTDYGHSWTSTDSQTFTFWVTPGQYGVVVSNPLTRRVTGNSLTGCTDDPTTASFTADSRTSQTYGDLSWVTGPIYLCNSSSYPVPYCVGSGSHN